jgi:hypothetical protein
MPSAAPNEKLIADLLAGFDQIFGLHPGFRAAHAKGIPGQSSRGGGIRHGPQTISAKLRQ